MKYEKARAVVIEFKESTFMSSSGLTPGPSTPDQAAALALQEPEVLAYTQTMSDSWTARTEVTEIPNGYQVDVIIENNGGHVKKTFTYYY